MNNLRYQNRLQIKSDSILGTVPNILMGRLSLGPPEGGAAEKNFFNKERTTGWGWGWVTASVEEGMVVRRWLVGYYLATLRTPRWGGGRFMAVVVGAVAVIRR